MNISLGINNNPLVTVIVPSYNHAQYITQCIESIMQQTYTNFELVVIDDGSKDASRSILTDIHSKYNFRLVFQENNGIAVTLNRGIKDFSKGKYITFCASDDYWALNKLEKQVKFMEENCFYPMCYGKNLYVDEKSNLIGNQDINNYNLKGGWLFDEIFLFKLHPPVNCLFRKSIFDEVGYYDEKIFAEDYSMNLKIASKYAIGFIDDYLGYYRYNDSPVKVARFDIVADSHLITIENYKNHCLYKKAKAMVYLRKFDTFSGFTRLKCMAFINMLNCLSQFNRKRFLFASIKLLIFWKS